MENVPSMDAVAQQQNATLDIARVLADASAPVDIPMKPKGRKRLLMGLQRTWSSSSVNKAGRASASNSYRGSGMGSMSCVSLATPGSSYSQSVATSYASELASPGYSTAPTSAATTPGPDSACFDQAARIRAMTGESRSSVPLPSDLRPASRLGLTPGTEVEGGDYFSRPITQPKKAKRRENFNFWNDMPMELKSHILQYLKPRQIVRCSAVSKAWYQMCFDGQLWSRLDTSEFYRDIPAGALVKIITTAGPFVRDLNLRGCVQLRDQWSNKGLLDACRNLENFSLEGCRIDRSSIHSFLLQNHNLLHINLSGLAGATNSAMKIIAQYCPRLEHLNVSWCNNVDTRGLKKVVESCKQLKDLRAGEVRGFDDVQFMNELHKRNTLERLVLNHCDSVNDESFAALIEGVNPEYDPLTDRPIVEPRKFKHLDLTRCRGLTDAAIKMMAHNVPDLEGLQLSKCHALTDSALLELLPTIPNLTHLDLEELEELTNASLQALANAPFAPVLNHLSISYCEKLGDTGMLPVLKSCPSLENVDMDNTRISDLVLAEAAAVVRTRPAPHDCSDSKSRSRPRIALRMVVYDCQNITWTGVREVLSRNAEIRKPSPASSSSPVPAHIIQLKCFYGWQLTVEEHTKRVMRGDFAAAARLERKWADFMMLNEEAGAGGSGGRRRRRRAREAQMLHADEEEGGANAGNAGTAGGIGRRRRARSGGCVIM